MKVNELRLGNWFFIPGLNRYVKVSAIFKTHFRCEDSDGISFEESIRTNYQPIPLTPEILVKAGFGQNGHFFNIRHLEYTLVSNRMWYKTKIIDKPLKYVHQLQNLYFALIGEELNIEL